MYFLMVATCLLGLESLVADEIRGMEARNVRAENGRVFFEGNEEILVRANINSRFSERILIVLGMFDAVGFDMLYDYTKSIKWSDYIGSTDKFPVKGYSLNSALYSVPTCQSVIKKAVVDSLSADYGIKSFEETGPVHQICFSIMKNNVTIMLDTSGAGLHKRGYRPHANSAPIKETLAAAMCKFAHLQHYHTLYDPCCGSGTILIEGTLLANNIAPGLNRTFQCSEWGLLTDSVWSSERQRSIEAQKKDVDFKAFGSDIDPEAIELAKLNAKNAGVDKFITFNVSDINDFTPESEMGTIVTNPPYGERMLDTEQAHKIYKIMGEKFPREKGWTYGIISPDAEFEKIFGRKADKHRKLYNGMIRCRYNIYFNRYSAEDLKRKKALDKKSRQGQLKKKAAESGGSKKKSKRIPHPAEKALGTYSAAEMKRLQERLDKFYKWKDRQKALEKERLEREKQREEYLKSHKTDAESGERPQRYNKDYGKRDSDKKNYGRNGKKYDDKKYYGRSNNGKRDYSKKNYGSNNNGKRDYNKKNYGRNDYGKKDYDKKNYSRNDYGKKSYDKKDYDRKSYDMKDYSKKNNNIPVFDNSDSDWNEYVKKTNSKRYYDKLKYDKK